MDKRRLRWRLAILACMYVGYMAVILCRTAIYAASPAMVGDPSLGLSKTLFGAILGWGTAGMVTGKLLNGWVADRLGGRAVFLLTLLITALAACAFAFVRGFPLFAALNFTMLLAAAAGWPAMAKLIAAWYEPAEFGRVWGIISTSSRLSAVLSTMLFGALLARFLWPDLFLAAGALSLAVAALAFFTLKGDPADVGLPAPQASLPGEKEPHPLDAAAVPGALRGFAASGRFWLICVSIMCTTILMEVIGFLPLYLKETFLVTASRAATASSVFPAGCFVALIAGGYLYDALSRKARVFLLGGMLALSCVCLLGLLSLRSFAAAAVLLFLYGLCVAPAYYLPMSVFSIEFGGKHCGLLIGLIDAAGYGASMCYQFAGGAMIDKPGGWRAMLWLLFALAVVATAATAAFALLDYRYHIPKGRPGDGQDTVKAPDSGRADPPQRIPQP